MVKLILISLATFALIFGLANAAFANTPGQHSVALSWTETDGTVVSYNIYRGTAAGVCSGNPKPLASSATKTFTDTTVVAGGTYVYAVSAVNGQGGESSCSTELQIAVPTSPASPSALQGVAN